MSVVERLIPLSRVHYVHTCDNLPLHFQQMAAHGNLCAMMKILEQDETVLNSTSKEGRSAFHMACYFGHVDVVRFLLTKAVDVNLCDNLGRSPLNRAIKGRDFKDPRQLGHYAGIVGLLLADGRCDPRLA